MCLCVCVCEHRHRYRHRHKHTQTHRHTDTYTNLGAFAAGAANVERLERLALRGGVCGLWGDVVTAVLSAAEQQLPRLPACRTTRITGWVLRFGLGNLVLSWRCASQRVSVRVKE